MAIHINLSNVQKKVQNMNYGIKYINIEHFTIKLVLNNDSYSAGTLEAIQLKNNHSTAQQVFNYIHKKPKNADSTIYKTLNT